MMRGRYLVLWKGQNEKDITWEVLENLSEHKEKLKKLYTNQSDPQGRTPLVKDSKVNKPEDTRPDTDPDPNRLHGHQSMKPNPEAPIPF